MEHLIDILKNGYSYKDAEGTHVLAPPNKYMLAAARELERNTKVILGLHLALDTKTAEAAELEIKLKELTTK